MIILAFDTCSVRCDACVYDSAAGTVLGEARLEPGKGHAEHLIGIIGHAIEASGIEYQDLDAIAVTVGPGSFTGVRVGVSAARGFALSLGIPAIGISTLQGLAFEARQIRPDAPVMAAVDARRKEIYAQLFDADGKPLTGPLVCDARAIGIDLPSGTILAGSGSAKIDGTGDRLFEDRSTPDVVTIARLAALTEPPFPKPRPLYLRKPEAKVQAGFAVARTGS